MTDNANIPDITGTQFTVRMKDNSGIKLPLHGMTDATGVNIRNVDVNGAALITFEQVAKATFRYALLAFTPVATPTDVLVIQGSGTKTVKIKSLIINGAATAQGSMPVQIIRRSTAGTLGSAVLTAIPNVGKHDTGDAAATAVVSTVGTANYTTLGTNAGVMGARRLGFPALSTGSAGFAQAQEWDFAWRGDKPWYLRGASDFICINFNGAAVPSGGVLDFEIETEEDAT